MPYLYYDNYLYVMQRFWATMVFTSMAHFQEGLVNDAMFYLTAAIEDQEV